MRIVIHRSGAKDASPDAVLAARDALLKQLVAAGRSCQALKAEINKAGGDRAAVMDIERAIDSAYQKAGGIR